MESPRKNNDCYFYYYSTCTKGDNCTFRHEPSALGCETMCSYWQQGKCLNQHCNFRHMELRKNRKAIPCYWETQPSGCRKPHCPFLHKNPREPVNVETTAPVEGTHEQKNERSDWNRRQGMENNQHVADITNNEIECARTASRRINQTATEPPTYGAPSVDPLVVNFEEESDNESTTNNTPLKQNHTQNVRVKTLEEIRIEKVQAETAALYFYGCADHNPPINNDRSTLSEADQIELDLRQRLISRADLKRSHDKSLDFEVLSLSEIKKRKLNPTKPKCNPLETVQTVLLQAKRELDKKENNLSEIRIKTLDEIRAERALKISNNTTENTSSGGGVKRSLSFSETKSTCKKPKINRKTSTDSNKNNENTLNGSTNSGTSCHNTKDLKIHQVPDVVADAVNTVNAQQNLCLDDELVSVETETICSRNTTTDTNVSADAILQDIDALLGGD